MVTGSRIARPDLDRLQPTQIVTSQTFDDRGYLDVGQALAELPAFGVSPSSPANTQAGFGIAQNFVDLYGLGSQRTLVLVNGRRFVSSSTASLNGAGTNNPVGGPGQQVDLNVIPTKLIDRVETVSVGGAPIYGADAIAGTVNIILKKDFQGFDLDAQMGVSNQDDAWNYRLRALAGQNFADGRGNITAVAEMTKTDGLTGTDRALYAQDLGFLAPSTPGKYQTVLTPANSVPQVNFGGIPLVDDVFFSPPIFGVPNTALGVTNGAGQLLAWGNQGNNLVPYNTGTQTGNPIFNEGGDGLRLSQVSNLLSPTERMNADVLGNFKVNDYVTAFAEGWFSETHATDLLTQPAYNAAIFGGAGTVNGNFVLNINNPYLSPADRALIQTSLNNYAANKPLGGFVDPNWNNSTFYVSRANIDLQSGRATATQVLARGVVGLNGDFNIGDHAFNWEIAVNYGSSNGNQVTPNYVFQNVQNALNSTLNSAGQIVCAGSPKNAPTTTLSSTCAPLDIFGTNSPSVAARQYITHLAQAQSLNTQRDSTVNFGGDLFKLPAGYVKLAVGYENRRESAEFSPDNFYLQDLGQAQVTAVSGDYHTNEAYAETLVPIFEPAQGIPALHRLEFEGAARRVDNSVAGDATTWTEGLKWSPTQDVQFRANRTKSIRAPAITELFLPSATVFSFASDPCDKNFYNQGTAPGTRKKNCEAAGINPTTFVSNVVNATAIGTTSGNTDLQSEIADSRTIGVVLQPRWVPRLNIAVDYIHIKLQQAIETLNLTQVLDACYDSSDYPNDPSCHDFTRSASGQITNFHVGYVNAGLLEFRGISSEVDYAFDLPRSLGNLSIRANYLDTKNLLSQVGSASQNDLAGELANAPGIPKSKGTLDLDYHYGALGWDWQGIFLGRINFNNQNIVSSNPTTANPNTQDYSSLAPWWVINSTISYDISKNFVARLIVDNVFDKQPPFPGLAGVQANFVNATTLYWSGIIGRTYQVSANLRF
ncbi:MAG TPA: TonB-dependent receptor [Steroidobacteraceae bacterium]|nr:TonB-dependent receptor [Steroidobacteraceae bacterium]